MDHSLEMLLVMVVTLITLTREPGCMVPPPLPQQGACLENQHDRLQVWKSGDIASLLAKMGLNKPVKHRAVALKRSRGQLGMAGRTGLLWPPLNLHLVLLLLLLHHPSANPQPPPEPPSSWTADGFADDNGVDNVPKFTRAFMIQR